MAYKVYGGLRFFERQEVKHALAYLRLAANPDDDTAFTRVVNFPPRGIGARSIEQLQEAAERGMGSLMHAARTGIVAGRSGTALAQFVTLVDNLRKSAETLTLPELIEEAIEVSRLKDHYAAEREGQDRVENLQELYNAAALFAEDFEHGLEPAGESQEDVAAAGTPEQQILAAFLSHASLEAGEREAAAGQDALQLMTVHSAKGLEFSAVFISGLEEGLFPHENSMLEDGGIEEERRLMYVALTRARKRLYLSYAGSRMLHGQPRYGIVSRFVEEIPAGALQMDRAAGEAVRHARGAIVIPRRALVGFRRRPRAAARREPLPVAAPARGLRDQASRRAPVRHRAERAPREVRRGRRDQPRGARAGCARAGALRGRGDEVAGAPVRQAHAGVVSNTSR